MFANLLLLLLGIAGIVGGAIITVDASKKIAKTLGISEMLIGLTIISIGTSLPEIAVNVGSGIANLGSKSLEYASGVAVGTNIGSCLTQITLILGIVGLVSGHIKANKKTIEVDGRSVLGAILVFFLVGMFWGNQNGKFIITRVEGIILIFLYIGYLVYTTKKDHIMEAHKKHLSKVQKGNIFIESFTGFIGIAILLLGTHLVVSNSITLADLWGVSKSFIGVMIIGVGTGLPELTTAITAALKNSRDISVGTLIGSNITDPLLSLGSGAAISGFIVNPNLLYFDIPFWFVATLIALFFMRRSTLGIDRKEALVLVLLYVIFVYIKLDFFL